MHCRPSFAIVALAITATTALNGCGSRVNVDEVPIGSAVQVTRQDGGLVEGALSDRDGTTVAVKAGPTTRTVPRGDIADFKVIAPDRPSEPPRTAKFREYLVPGQTALKITLETAVSSETSQAGDRIEARLAEAVRVDDVEVLPAGSLIHGTVAGAESAGKVKGRASLALHFDAIEVRQERYPISADIAAEAKSTKGKDAATIGIGAAAGAIIGGIAGGGKGAATGAAIGGGGGTAIVLVTEGKPVTFNRGTSMTVRIAEAIDVRVPIGPSKVTSSTR